MMSFTAGDLAVVPRRRSDGVVVRRPVVLLAQQGPGFQVAKIVSRELPPASLVGRPKDLKEAFELDGCGLHRASFVLPEWFFFQHFTPDWRRIGQVPTPLFNKIMAKYGEAAAYRQIVGRGKAVYGA
jgi:hypothetical protein